MTWKALTGDDGAAVAMEAPRASARLEMVDACMVAVKWICVGC